MTAVEFQTQQIGILVSKLFNNEISKTEFHFKRFEICDQAKEMENKQQGYSEEEVLDIAKQSFVLGKDFGLIGTFNEWFEQFKNK